MERGEQAGVRCERQPGSGSREPSRVTVTAVDQSSLPRTLQEITSCAGPLVCSLSGWAFNNSSRLELSIGAP